MLLAASKATTTQAPSSPSISPPLWTLPRHAEGNKAGAPRERRHVQNTKRRDVADESSDEEVAIDLYGQKHMDVSDRDGGMYYFTGLDNHYFKYSADGEDSDQEMRDYLWASLSGQFIQDEYGDVEDISRISSQHIPKLQAKLWRESPKAAAKVSSFETKNMTDDHMIVAKWVAMIADAFESKNTASKMDSVDLNPAANHVFVLCEGSSFTCSLPLCQKLHEELDLSYHGYKLSVEPLVDWATLDIVHDLDLFENQILVYRRNDSLSRKYGLDIRQFISKEPIAFCVECLQFLWDRRVESWFIVDRYPGIAVSFGALASCSEQEAEGNDMHNEVEQLGEAADHKYDSWDESPRHDKSEDEGSLSPSGSQPAREGGQMPCFQLDGSWSPTNRSSTPFKIWAAEVETSDAMGDTTRGPGPAAEPNSRRPDRNGGVQGTAHNMDASQTRSVSGWTTVNALKKLHTTPQPIFDEDEGELLQDLLHNGRDPTFNKPFQGTFSISEEEKYPHARAGIPISPPQEYEYKPGIKFMAPPMKDCGLITTSHLIRTMRTRAERRSVDERVLSRERRFGKEIQPSTVDNFLPLVKRPSIQPSPFGPPAALNLFSSASLRIPSFSSTRHWLGSLPERRVPFALPAEPSGGIDAEPSKQRRTFPIRPFPATDQPSPFSNILPADRAASPHYLSGPPTPKPPRPPVPRLEAPKSPFHNPKTPVIGKPWPYPLQHPVEDATEAAQQRCIPAASAVICVCHKRADTLKVRIVQCWNPECTVSWFHYDCLDKSGKLSSLHGKWLCDACKAEKVFGKAAKTTDMRMPFSAQEIVDGAFVPGGAYGVENPYGLGGSMGLATTSDVSNGRNRTACSQHSWPPATGTCAGNEGNDAAMQSQARTTADTTQNGDADTQLGWGSEGSVNFMGYVQSTPYWFARTHVDESEEYDAELDGSEKMDYEQKDYGEDWLVGPQEVCGDR